MTDTPSFDAPAVAIVGLAGRFPGAADVEALWRNLRDGVESVSFFDRDALVAAGIHPELVARPDYVPARATLDGVELFDAPFFGFGAREAELTDPQQRLFLEIAWEAFERAGYDPAAVDGPVGVWAGSSVNAYLLRNLASHPEIAEADGLFQVMIHNRPDHLATRVAYKLDLHGPAVTVQTACSTSLVATAMACQSLVGYECDLALAGGSTVSLPQTSGYLYQEGGIESPDGHCRPYDHRAAGTIDGSGVAAVVLKRLEDALADGDHVHAVIRSWALNNDGAQKIGYTAPSIDHQAEVIASAHALAGVDARTIGFVEGHGTGTPLGDPVEVEALQRAFRLSTDATGFCALGSIKSNFGHLDAAAGIAGLIKATLALEHGEIPPTVHFEAPNPRLGLDDSPFYVNATVQPWTVDGGPRRAGVSSFGIGGTNAHLVLEQAPARPAGSPSRPWQLLQLSAPTAAGLERASENLAAHLRAEPEVSLADVAFSLRRRRRFAHRRSLACSSAEEAAALLESLDVDRVSTRHQPPLDRPVIFMFPGQGAQHPGMAAHLYDAEPVFRRELDACLEALGGDLAGELRELLGLLDPAVANSDDAASRLASTDRAQPALFAVEHALARLWTAWGVAPRAMIGHSVGEYAAACLAGVFPLETAARLVAERGRLMAELPGGSMLAVAQSEESIGPLLEEIDQVGGRLALAAVNGRSQVTVSGPDDAVDALERELAERGVTTRRLQTSHAFHSSMMEPILEPMEALVRAARPQAPEIPFLSNLTGDWITEEEATDPGYWARHLRGTVRFADGVGRLLAEPHALLLEVGPGRSLKTITRWRPDKSPDQLVETSMPHPKEPRAGQEHLLSALGRLWLAGVEIDWNAFRGDERRLRLPLPTVPFERRRYWIDAVTGPAGAGAPAAVDGRRKPSPGDWFYVPLWKETALPPAGPHALSGRRALIVSGSAPAGAGEPEDLAAALERRLAGAGARVAVVRDDAALDLSDLPDLVIQIVASTAASEAPDDSSTRADDLLAESFHRPLGLARRLLARSRDESSDGGLDVLFVTAGLADVTGEEPTLPERSALLGPARVLPREQPSIRTRVVDVRLPDPRLPGAERRRDLVLDALVAEAARPLADRDERTVALRGSRRFVEAFEPLPLPAATDDSETAGDGAGPVRRQGVYLITGGLGGVGGAVAEWLARTAQARLVLVGRTPLPPRDEWAALEPQDDATAARVRQVLRLEELGAEVLPLAADVTDATALEDAVARAHARFGAIHGAVHAAGIAGGSLIRSHDDEGLERAAAVLAPKVTGTRHLAEALAGEPLDFLLLFSSLAGVVGRLGQAAYGTANAYLDAFARSWQARTGVPTTAVDWGEWRGVGMAAAAASGKPDGTASGDDAGAGEETGHPLLGRRRVLPSGAEVFTAVFSVDTHWVLDEHRLVGHPVIPGVAYIEMVRAALGERAADRLIEISDLLFVGPLRVREGHRRTVTLTLTPDGDGFRFAVESRADADEGGDGSPRPYALGRVALADPEPPRTIDPKAIWQRLDRREKVFSDEDREDDLGPRWQCPRRMHLGDDEVITLLELPEEFEGDLATFGYHPSLMDRAAGVAKDHVVEEEYLPLSYGRLRIHGRIPRRIYSHARLDPSVDPSGETLTWNTTVCDETGRVVAELRDFSQKRINDAAAALKAYAGPADGPGAAAGSTGAPSATGATGDGPEAPPESASEAMTADEGIEALSRLLAVVPSRPQVAVSVRDLRFEIAHADAGVRERIAQEAGRTPERVVPRHPRPQLDTPFRAPDTEPEQDVAGVWEDLLGVEGIGADDDFFALGGDSVQAIQIIARLNELGWELSPQEFFQHATVGSLAELVGAGPTARGARSDGADTTPASPTSTGTDRTETTDAYPLTPLQHGMLAASLRRPGTGLYTEQVTWVIEGGFDRTAFATAWRRLLERHPALATDFLWRESGAPVQRTHRGLVPPWDRLDWSGLTDDARAAELPAWLEADRRRGFELDRAPLLRLTEIELGPDRRRFVWTYHHLLLDGWSVSRVLGDLFLLYETERAGAPAALPPVRPFRDYVAWLEGREPTAAEAFWRDELAGFDEPTPLPGLGAAPGADDGTGFATAGWSLTAEETAALQDFARRRRLTVNTLVVAAWGTVLARYSGRRDVVFGTVVSGRPPSLSGVETIVGLFINTVPARVRLDPSRPLADWLADLQARQLEARHHDHLPLVAIQAAAGVRAGRDLFESLLAVENLPQDEALRAESESLGVHDLERSAGRTGYPLTLEVFVEEALRIDWTYDRARLDAATVEWIGASLRTLLRALPALGEATVGDLPTLPDDRRVLLREWSGAAAPLPEADLVALFDAVAGDRPDAVALVADDRALTYGALARRSRELAHRLRRAGVGTEAPVGLALERSPELITALLGVLRAGGVYVPLDPDYPAARLRFMAEDAGLSVVVTAGPEPNLPVPDDVTVLPFAGRPDREDETAGPAPAALPERLAYVMYTSGSTGRPKGVAIPQRAVVRLILGTDYAAWGPDEVLLGISATAFDASTFEIWGALLHGARLELTPPGPRSLEDLGRFMEERRVSLCFLTTGLFHQMVERQGAALAGVRQILTGGEVVSPRLAAELMDRPGERLLSDVYGPTESTTFATAHRVEAASGHGPSERPLPIGRPIPNTRTWIADAAMTLVPAGAPGELLLGGAGLARGYLGRPGLTAERFLPDPWSGEAGARVYRTGDRASFRPDGAIDFLGRIDRQLKVRGFRIEAGEVETALDLLPAVAQSAVDRRGDALVAWVEPADGVAPEPTELRRALAATLPEFMVPSRVVILPEMPLTAHGKIDRSRLPEPDATDEAGGEAAFREPRNDVERDLCELFAELLGRDRVGIDDDFFDLGGHSLLATQLVTEIRLRLGVELPLQVVFEAPRVEALADRVVLAELDAADDASLAAAVDELRREGGGSS